MSEQETANLMSDALWAKLREVDTPTVCNAIEVAQGKRGFAAFTRGTFQTSAPDGPAMVGFARTAKIAGREPPTEAPGVIRARRMDYFRHMDAGDLPKVAVTEDLDGDQAVSAWWGEVHTNVHKGLGCVGAISSGPMRDLGDMAEGFPVLAGSLGPSHAFVHVREIGTGATVMNLDFEDGDLIHADRHGALVIPPSVIPNLLDAILKMQATEHIVINPSKEDGFNFDKLQAAWAEFEKART